MPRFAHDCDQCIFLGSDSFTDSHDIPVKDFDVYFCPTSFPSATMILRWSNEPYNYFSCPVFLLGAPGQDHAYYKIAAEWYEKYRSNILNDSLEIKEEDDSVWRVKKDDSVL